MSKNKNKNNLYKKDGWQLLPFDLNNFMSLTKSLLIFCVFVISSYQWGYNGGDLMWQCIWSLSLIKLVELSDE
tara:strand:- start:428 stop:646 length:219 start_codon:yes stop_codon:yes gene_type:complete